MLRVLMISLALLLAGCAAAPDRISIEVDHTSHIAQHFGSDKTGYGYESAQLVAHWQAKDVYADVGEGVVLDSCTTMRASWAPSWRLQECGAMEGPRELFTAKVGLILWEKP